VHVDAARLVLGAGFLVAASLQDWRTRKIDDRIWVAMGSCGLAILAADGYIHLLPWEHFLILIPAAILFYATFYGKELLDEHGWHLRPARIALFAVAGIVLGYEGYALVGTPNSGIFYGDLAIPVMILLALVFYHTGLLHGGADVKALMAVTLLAPTYPALGTFPLLVVDARLTTAYPFSLAVLTNAAFAFVFAPLILLAVNARRGTVKLPRALFGYRVPIDKVPRFTWVMEVVRDGARRVVYSPRRTKEREEALADLRAVGATDVWVMPQIPFIVPITGGFILGFLVGNLLMGIMAAALP